MLADLLRLEKKSNVKSAFISVNPRPDFCSNNYGTVKLAKKTAMLSVCNTDQTPLLSVGI